MAEKEPRRQNNLPALAAGAGLILFGVLFLAARLAGTLFHVDIGRFLWPFWVIVPGVLLFGWGMTQRGRSGLGLVMAGSIVTMVGLILLFGSVTGLWAAWAYAWALIAPTSVGLGMLLFGAIKGQPDLVRSGRQLTLIGLALFAAFAFFFEGIIGVSGFGLGRLGRFALPVLLIGGGIAVLAAALLWGRRKV